MVEPGKTAVRRAVGRELKRMRNAKGLNLRAAAESTEETGDKALMQVERGRNLPQLADVDALLSTYGCRDQIPNFQSLLANAGKRSWKDWWENRFPADFVPEHAKLLLSCEASAVTVRSYQAQFVPELFQTRDYATAMVRASMPHASDDEVELWSRLAEGRQDVLDRADPPEVLSVLDESVLRRRVGGEDVFKAQLAHLAELATRPNIDIRVLTEDSGAHAGAGGSFTRIALLPELPTYPGIVHVRTAAHDLYYEDPQDIDPFDEVWTLLEERALPTTDSRALIEEFAG
ncbi:helix-turn-helix domain-containing protein [Prauserella cavernicola]|uniref:Helix-turn-helix domain-containing protein n=1 Tax=Prauserella cavernicola TaxID=2800127 RepID=A0A934QUE7_9PSEU|nr:helix-turn-helix transcriptional regulator [Prauserella cavernicola]MBK1788437.1 helix-turn-helix domain-containing protein [Prauserella cavernicola]